MFIAKFGMFKDFDSINRDSLLHRLKAKRFPEIFIKWVQACITDVPFSIIVNGEIRGYFHTKSGLRQGCPLSPLLFTVVMDIFSCLLEQAIRVHTYTPMVAGDKHIAHLLFADDLLVMGFANN